MEAAIWPWIKEKDCSKIWDALAEGLARKLLYARAWALFGLCKQSIRLGARVFSGARKVTNVKNFYQE